MKRICPICQKEYDTRKIVDDIIKDFPDKTDKWTEMECPNNNMHWKILEDKKIAKLPKEIRQKVLDLMNEGKTIGEVCETLNLETMTVSGIITQNIREIHVLRTEAI